MSSYLPENVYAVCLNQLGKEYRQLQLSDERAEKKELSTVKLGSESRVFLVKLDKKLNKDFTCKSGCSSGAGTAAVGVGVVAGMATAVGIGAATSGLAGAAALAAGLAAIPIAGWIAGGIIAIGCIGYGLYQMFKSPTCSQMIGYEESKWINHHKTVRFDSSKVEMKDKFLALTKNSKLVCKEPGGILLPFISETMAKQAAESIGGSNQKELGTNVIAGLFTGFLLGFGLGGVAAATGSGFTVGSVHLTAPTISVLTQSLAFGGWTLAGHYLINPYIMEPLTGSTSEIAANVRGTTDSYDEFKNISNPKDSPLNTVPNPTEMNDTLETLYKVKSRMEQIGASKQEIAEINNAINKAKNAGTYSSKSVQEIKEVLGKVKNGDYGKEVQKIFSNKNNQMTGMNKEANYNKALNVKQQNIKENTSSNNKAIRNGVISLLFPFISAYFGNEAIRLGAEIYEQDAANSVSANATAF